MAENQEPPLNGAQMSALNQAKAEMMRRVLVDVELRKLALDQTVKVVSILGVGGTPEFIGLAQAMHGFLTDQGEAAVTTAPAA